MDMRAGRFFSLKTPRGPLPWSLLAAIGLLTLAALCLVWAIAESKWGQWVVIVAALLVWNVLVVLSGERLPHGQPDRDGSVAASVLLLLGLIALLAVAVILDAALRDSALYPGRETIGFVVISLPLMAWANMYFRNSYPQP